jgi:hypothetical protein
VEVNLLVVEVDYHEFVECLKYEQEVDEMLLK